jgi:ABC-type uncharacterized transport system auxiliary subunit
MKTIYQGSTPTNEFSVPFPAEVIDKVIVTYEQNDAVVLEKHTKDLKIADYSVTAKLTQEETMRFESGKIVVIQIKVKTTDGEVIPSDKIYANGYEVLNKEVL